MKSMETKVRKRLRTRRERKKISIKNNIVRYRKETHSGNGRIRK